jgi:hypothetical protein
VTGAIGKAATARPGPRSRAKQPRRLDPNRHDCNGAGDDQPPSGPHLARGPTSSSNDSVLFLDELPEFRAAANRRSCC